jgi:ubiquitin-conjugating enzyme E2 J2
MSTNCIRRLMKEYRTIQQDPPPFVVARPEDDNVQLWYFVLEGPPDSPYEGGVYLGKLRFPDEYPFAPPSIMMCTPSGRFKTETRLCLSMSDFHPKDWNPTWGPASILKGLLSFMLEDTQTSGSMESTVEEKQGAARQSLEFNLAHPVFGRLFPEKDTLCRLRLDQSVKAKETVEAAAPLPVPKEGNLAPEVTH